MYVTLISLAGGPLPGDAGRHPGSDCWGVVGPEEECWPSLDVHGRWRRQHQSVRGAGRQEGLSLLYLYIFFIIFIFLSRPHLTSSTRPPQWGKLQQAGGRLRLLVWPTLIWRSSRWVHLNSELEYRVQSTELAIASHESLFCATLDPFLSTFY